jgi:hypothetical protein
MTRPLSSRHARNRRSWFPNAARLRFERLEDRTTPTGGSWAILADPEGDVFHDVNGNGTRDVGESTVGPGWTVYVDTNENGALDAGEVSTLTDATGHYNLLLPDGTYSIRVVAQSPFQDDRRPLGTVLTDFASIENAGPTSANFSGLAWVNGSLYVTFTRFGGADNVMYQVDPQTGAALGSAVSIPGEVGEIAFDGTDFWGADYINDAIIRFNFAGQELQRLSFAGMDVNSVEWDGATLRVLDLPAGRIYQIDPAGSGTILGYISTPPDPRGLAFDGHYLWVNSRDTREVYALDPASGTVQRSFPHHGEWGYGLAIRGTNLWLADKDASRVFQYDLGYGGGRVVTVEGAPVAGVDLAVFQLGSISGRVFNDNNQNGAQDADDAGLAGWRVYVESNANGQFDPWETASVTDALGNYTLSGLRSGPNTVALDVAGQRQPRWSQVAPAGGTYSVALNSGEAVSGKDFANFLDRTTPISSNEWGSFQGGEMSLYTGLAWVDFAFFATYAAATAYVADSTQAGYTDWRLPNKTEGQAAGSAGLGGRWNVPFGSWWSSTPLTGQKIWTVDLTTGGAYYEYRDAGESVAGVRDTGLAIDDGAAGYTATGFSTKSTNGAYQGDQSTAAKGTGTKTATWTFTGLEPGATYKIDTTWKPVSGAATNAPFTILEASTVVGSRSLNQAVAPNDFTVGATNWEGLGHYTLAGSSLTVRLSNLANGTVIADAVRIFKVLPSYAPPAPLMAAGVAPPAHDPGPALTTAAVRPLLDEAIRRWAAGGADVSALANLDVRIADLGGATLGLASGQTIWLDDDAAGWGWFLDPTPADDSEFLAAGDQGEEGRMDLLTALVHELGHVLGHDHDEGGAMGETLAAGERPDRHGADVHHTIVSVVPLADGEDALASVTGRRKR